MKVNALHSWKVTIAEAYEIQRSLAPMVIRNGTPNVPRFIAGTDISHPNSRGMARGAVIVLRFPELVLAAETVVEEEVDFPYVPGLLSFRETPLILTAFHKLKLTPDIIIADAQGIAHPRRLGMASHLGLLLDIPTIGCAKAILCGSHSDLSEEPGAQAPIVDRGEVIGAALRTKQNTKPVYISIGHRVSLKAAIHLVMACCKGYRLPEPTRLAHMAAGKLASPSTTR